MDALKKIFHLALFATLAWGLWLGYGAWLLAQWMP
jgi:hypothetical protein